MLLRRPLPKHQARDVPPRILAHLGDAVFHLFERENEVLNAVSVRQMHEKMAARASAASQSAILDAIQDRLEDEEKEIVRRARNVKSAMKHNQPPSVSRKATALEALLGYLYLTAPDRLSQILALIREQTSAGSSFDS